MKRGRYLRVEDGKPDGLDVFPRSVESRDIYNCLGWDAIIAPKDQCAFVLFRPLLDPANEIGVNRPLDQTVDFILVARRHVLKAIDALVDVGQREDIQENVDRREHPKKDAIAEKILAYRRQVQPGVAAHIVGSAQQIN